VKVESRRGASLAPIGVDAVILDMDGLMLDTERLYKRAWQQAASQLGYGLDDDFYFTLVGCTNAAGERALAEHFGPAFPLIAFRERWAELWREEVEVAGIPLKPGLSELLAYLADQGIPVAVATSSDRDYAAFSLKMAGLDARRFAHVVTGEQVARGKPAPDIYLEAAGRLGVDPAGCIAIEDSDAGVLSASAAGMRAVMVPDLKPPSLAAREAAFRVLTSLHEVAPLLSEVGHESAAFPLVEHQASPSSLARCPAGPAGRPSGEASAR
jgi:HAD superfamily hydrolase (TIGR01509 family)